MNKFSVVIADDESAVSMLLLRIFETEMREIHVAASLTSGEAVIDFLKSGAAVDILILDIKMPKKTGLDVAQYIKDNGMNVSIVLMSGYHDFEYARQAVNLGVNCFLTKPIQIDEFVATVREICALREEALQQEIQQSREVLNTWNAERAKFKLYFKNDYSMEMLGLTDNMLALSQNPCALIRLRLSAATGHTFPAKTKWRDMCEDDNSEFCSFCVEENPDSALILLLLKNKDDELREISEAFAKNSVKMLQEGETGRNIRFSCEYYSSLTGIKGGGYAGKQSGGNIVVEYAVQYVKEHYAETPSLSFLADKYNISYAYLSRAFKRSMGISYIDFLKRTRIDAAAWLLRHKAYTVEQVAGRVGYSDVSYFIEQFSGIIGQTPKQFAETGKEEDADV